MITSGKWSTSPPLASKRLAASPSRSSSSHLNGTWLRVRKSFTSWEGADQRWPTTRVRSSDLIRSCIFQSSSRSSSTGYSFSCGRVPRFQQVILHIRLVDGRYGCISVGVGGKQDAAGFRVKLARLLEELHAGHPRHAVVGEQQAHLLVPELELFQRLQGLGPDSARRIR